jgi:DNA segregation ATPase FtsK/SpoIIIE, S-DNA-T family
VEAVTGYAPDALLVVVVLVGVWLLVTVVRYVRADRGTRVSMRQAVRVRWGWVRLARMAGLTVTDKTPACSRRSPRRRTVPPQRPGCSLPGSRSSPTGSA